MEVQETLREQEVPQAPQEVPQAPQEARAMQEVQRNANVSYYSGCFEGLQPEDVQAQIVAGERSLEFIRHNLAIEEINHKQVPALLGAFEGISGLWTKLVNRAKLEHIYNHGLDQLVSKLNTTLKDADTPSRDLLRAKMWLHVAEQCSEGKSEIPDLTDTDAFAAWMPNQAQTKTVRVSCMTCGKRFSQKRDSKFGSCRTCRGEKLHIAGAIKETGSLPSGWKSCQACQEAFEPKRSDAVCCYRVSCGKQRAVDKQKAVRQQKLIASRPVMPNALAMDISVTH